MAVFLSGTGAFDFRIHLGRIEYEAVADHLGQIPPEGLRRVCLAVIVLDPRNPYDFGNGVAAGVVLKAGAAVPAGWFHWKQGRQYREQISAFGLVADDPVLCLGKLCGGEEIQYRKGPRRMPFHLFLDLHWPLNLEENWHDRAAPFLGESEPT